MRINYKWHIGGLITIAIITSINYYYTRPANVGNSKEFAQKRVAEVVSNSEQLNWKRGKPIMLVKTEQDAITLAEIIASNVYGREQVLSERPYSVYHIDRYWYVAGSLPRRWTFGGGFEIILDAHDARVLSIIHYK